MRLLLALTVAAMAAPSPPTAEARVLQVRVDAVPLAPELAVLLGHHGLTPPARGGAVTHTGAAFPMSGGLVTSAHVVAGARTATLVAEDGTLPLDVSQVRLDVDHDVAWWPAPGTAGLRLAPATGPDAWAVGFPDDGPRSTRPVTLGAAADVDLPGQGRRSLLRFTGPVRPGDSGGPLLDADGRVVGLITAGSEASSDLGGDGLATAADVVAAALDGLTHDAPLRAGLFVAVHPEGAQVVRVVPGGPADAAGLRPDDVVSRVDGLEVTVARLARRLTTPGPHTLRVARPGGAVDVVVTPAAPEHTPGLTVGTDRAVVGCSARQSAFGLDVGDVILAVPGVPPKRRAEALADPHAPLRVVRLQDGSYVIVPSSDEGSGGRASSVGAPGTR